MPLPLPILDNRTFDEMFTEGLSTVPRSAPAWTDFNYSDPGITLLDLITWLTELDVYRLDRTPEASYRSFLRLLGFRPHPPQCADTTLVFSSTNLVQLPAGLQVGADSSIIFQTVHDLSVSPANLVKVLASTESALVDCSTQNQDAGGSYQPFGAQPKPGNALYLGFDSPLADQAAEVSLYVWAGEAEAEKKMRGRLIAEWEAELAERAAICGKEARPDVPDWRVHYSARTIWEYYGQPGAWTPLNDTTDETRALTLNGPVRFTAPGADQQVLGGLGGTQFSDLYFIRCRLVSGGYECPPDIEKVALNAVEARNAADSDGPETFADPSKGQARQKLQLQHKPVVPGSTKVRVGATDSVPEVEWREEPVWDEVGAHTAAYVLSPENGVITFGDGRVGLVPATDATFTATYQIGGGADGNVPAKSLTVPLANAHNSNLVPSWNTVLPGLTMTIDQPFAASGGADAEPLVEAIGRAVRSLDEPSRPVTLADFETLARETPGVPVAQAYALADYSPAFPCLPALGAVTVVVIPSCPADRPQPSPEFLQAVDRYLARRRILTSEVHVVGPSYTIVSVSATLNVATGVDSQKLAQQAQSVLAAFLNPLSGGPGKNGWPAGRSVFRAEVMALLQDLPGVVYVDPLTLQADGGPAIGCDNVSICRHALVASGQHKINVKTAGGRNQR